MLQGSWRTSLIGWAAVLGAVGKFLTALLDGDATTVPDFDAILIALSGVGLMLARDNKVTSETAGAK
jgi:hypothetical protein